MDKLVPVCLAEFLAIKGIALVAFGVVAYLFWLGWREKRDQRREREWLAETRRALKEKAANKPELPPRQ